MSESELHQEVRRLRRENIALQQTLNRIIVAIRSHTELAAQVDEPPECDDDDLDGE